jgi:hypothetical protein
MTGPILPAIQAANKLALQGPFGSGKTELAIARVRWLLEQERVRGDDIIVLVPQRTLARPYHEALRSAALPPGPLPVVTTVASLVRDAAELYWPLLAAASGFTDPAREPTFLTLETSQYHMGRFVDEAVAQGDFDGVRVERNRVISQVLDNLNKAALNGLTIDDAYGRLELAVPLGEQRTARLNALRAAAHISRQFRQLCLDETLLDFSLQVELFNLHVLRNDWSRTHLLRRFRHLIFDNVEEDTVTAHNLVAQWLPHLTTALLMVDDDGGYRTFLGADPNGADALLAQCDEHVRRDHSNVMSTGLAALAGPIDATLGDAGPGAGRPRSRALPSVGKLADILVVPRQEFRFYPQMIAWVVETVRTLVQEEGVPAGEIALLAPFVSDALRFSVETGLAEHGISLTTHRPSRALEDEPAARALMTLAQLAHPEWSMRPAPADVTLTLALTIQGLDPVRASLLSQIAYPPRRRTVELGTFGGLVPAMQERITFVVGERYDALVAWLAAYRGAAEPLPLDQFLARLFGELLSQPGFNFHEDFDAARVANQMVESARKFRWALEGAATLNQPEIPLTITLGREYVRLFEGGALGALYVPGWREADDAVFLAPAYTFLMRNRPVDTQIWLDIGSGGWWERLYQPLTHPFVLSPTWPAHEIWSDFHEFRMRQETMRRLLLGLVRRTRRRIYLGMSDYSESGFEQRGPLLSLANRLLIELGYNAGSAK